MIAGMMLPFTSIKKYDSSAVVSLKDILRHRVCENVMMRILGKGLKFWHGCQTALVDGIKVHGNVANKNAVKYDIAEALTTFLESMEEYAEPIATLIVHSKTELITKICLKNGERGVVCLPPYWSQRGLYTRFCMERGWDIKQDNGGKYL
jgi:hypothetical protein